MYKKLILLTSFVVVLAGMLGSVRGDTLFHWTFDGGVVGDEFVSDTDIVSGAVATKFDDSEGPDPMYDVKYGEGNIWYNSGGTSADFQNDPATNNPGVGLRVPDTGVDTPLDLSTLGQFTIEAFIYPYTLRQSVIVRKWKGNGRYCFYLRDDGDLKFAINSDDHAAGAGAGTIQADTWYHVAAVFNENDTAAPMKIYVDGELKGTAAFSERVIDSTAAFGIGCIIRDNDDPPSSSGQFFDGRIDEVRISDEALDPGQFLLMGGGIGGATRPKPGSGATKVCPEGVVLSWKPWEAAGDTNGHDVYFGTDYNDVNDANTNTAGIYKGRQDSNTYPESGSLSLELNTTYYWRIDEVNETDANLWPGLIWKFTTEDGKAQNPFPVDGWKGLPPDANLSWTPSCIATSHHLYFGTSFADVNNGTGGTDKGNQSPGYNPGPLQTFTWYYWRVDEVGSTTIKGDVWSFKTGLGGVLMYYKFDGSQGSDLPSPITDDSGNNIQFTKYVNGGSLTYGPANPMYNVSGTSADFDPCSGLYRLDTGDDDILRLDTYQYTIEMWLYINERDYDEADMMLIGKGGDNAWTFEISDLGKDDDLRWYHNDRDIDKGVLTDRYNEWMHVAVVFDLTDPDATRKLYFNGEVVETGNTDDVNPADANAVSIGCERNSDGTSRTVHLTISLMAELTSFGFWM